VIASTYMAGAIDPPWF